MNGNLPTFVRVSTLDGHSNQNAGFSPADMHAACYQPKTTENRLHYVQSLFNTTENRPLCPPSHRWYSQAIRTRFTLVYHGHGSTCRCKAVISPDSASNIYPQYRFYAFFSSVGLLQMSAEHKTLQDHSNSFPSYVKDGATYICLGPLVPKVR